MCKRVSANPWQQQQEIAAGTVRPPDAIDKRYRAGAKIAKTELFLEGANTISSTPASADHYYPYHYLLLSQGAISDRILCLIILRFSFSTTWRPTKLQCFTLQQLSRR